MVATKIDFCLCNQNALGHDRRWRAVGHAMKSILAPPFPGDGVSITGYNTTQDNHDDLAMPLQEEVYADPLTDNRRTV